MLIYIISKLQIRNELQLTILNIKEMLIIFYQILPIVFFWLVVIVKNKFISMLGNSNKKDILGNYDFSRTDKFYELRIPTYCIDQGVVFYQMHLKDLTNCEIYRCKYRFKQLKNVHQSLQSFDFELPPFPKTHFWQKTNSNPELIQKRRIGLQEYFSKVINDPYLRGYPEVKKIIRMCKKGKQNRRRRSDLRTEDSSSTIQRSLSFDKASQDVIPKQQWQRLRRKNSIA